MKSDGFSGVCRNTPEEQREGNPAAHVQAVRGDAIQVEGLRPRDMGLNENK